MPKFKQVITFTQTIEFECSGDPDTILDHCERPEPPAGYTLESSQVLNEEGNVEIEFWL